MFFFFKQKTAYEMRISDWSSDVCSSDLIAKISERPAAQQAVEMRPPEGIARRIDAGDLPSQPTERLPGGKRGAARHPGDATVRVGLPAIGRASCRARVCQYV